MTEYVLDYSKWRSGGSEANALGEGGIKMLNEEGYQCCLGQFASQCGVPDEILIFNVAPSGVNRDIGAKGRYDPAFVAYDGHSSVLARALMAMNDCSISTVTERIVNIREALEENGHTLVVINLPEELEDLG